MRFLVNCRKILSCRRTKGCGLEKCCCSSGKWRRQQISADCDSCFRHNWHGEDQIIVIVLNLLILACSIHAEMSGRYRQSFRKHYGEIRVMWHTWKGLSQTNNWRPSIRLLHRAWGDASKELKLWARAISLAPREAHNQLFGMPFLCADSITAMAIAIARLHTTRNHDHGSVDYK